MKRNFHKLVAWLGYKYVTFVGSVPVLQNTDYSNNLPDAVADWIKDNVSTFAYTRHMHLFFIGDPNVRTFQFKRSN